LESDIDITLPYQKKWLLDDSRFKIGMWSRQSRKTTTCTLEIVLDCVQRKSRWVILSRGERQAKEAMNEGIKRFCYAYQITARSLNVNWQGNYNMLEVVLPNGSRITALPANPDTARGFSANVLLDEFAFHYDSRAIWSALFPVISAGHKLRVVSTPNGKQNKFYELITSQEDIWSKHIVTIYDAINQGLNRDIAELRSAINDEDAWKQEYELEWLDESSAWLDYDLIHSTEDENAGDPLKYEGNPVYIGNDIAIRNDLWVAWVIEQIGDVLWTREVIAKQRISFSEQDRIMDSLFERYKVARLCIDKTGIGEKPTEDATRRYGKNIIEGVTFTSSMKLVLATVGKQAFESKRIRIPKNDNALVNDLHKIKKSVTATGASRFVAESDSSGHADRAWACFLACYAASSGRMVYDWKTVNSKPGAW